MEVRAPRGTRDILPEEVATWQRVEDCVRKACELAGYREIRTPIFEHTELFERGIGPDTDIVEKEMYTFLDRGKRSITLRPEGTASIVRAYLEHRMYSGPQPVKLYYIGPMFRYERPQAGRYRQFWQFGVEALGSADPAMDAETVELLVEIYRMLGLEGLEVELNSIGCPACRAAYRAALKEALAARLPSMCEDCRRRFGTNPLRILDCKNPACREALGGVPEMSDFLCPECRGHFEGVMHYLGVAGIAFHVNPRIVRGLDYYTRTVFEVVHPGLGAQNVLGGGGRYDGLVEECGGPPTPAVGFASGMERLASVLPAEEAAPGLDVFVIVMGEEAKDIGFRLVGQLRRGGMRADMDYLGRTLKGQMKFADKLGARQAVIIGPEEVASGLITLRDMRTGEQRPVGLNEVVGVLLGNPAMSVPLRHC